MNPSLTFYRSIFAPLLILSLPLIVTGVIESSITFFSTFFLAKLGEQAIAAGALVNWVFATLMVVMWGALTAVSVVVAQKQGEKNKLAISEVLRDGLTLGLLLVIPSFLIIWNMAPILILFGQSPALVTLAQSYFHALAWGILPDFTMLVLLQFLIGLGHTRVSMLFIMFWVPVAIFCNYILIFGLLGFPKLGIAGIGWGMTASYWLTAGFLIAYLCIQRDYREYLRVA
ncbi:MAG: MATE family efflux transporter, partial [Gammaproteobacteria bacterium]